MTKQAARKMDKAFYVEFDNDSGAYCVFGDNSGFAYASFAAEQSAQKCCDDNNLTVNS